MGFFDAIGDIAGAFIEGDAQKDASKEQRKAAESAQQQQRYFYERSRADQLPYMGAGYGALDLMMQQMGITPGAPPAIPGGYGAPGGPGGANLQKPDSQTVAEAYRYYKGREATPYEVDFYTNNRPDQFYGDIIGPGQTDGTMVWDQKGSSGSPYTGNITPVDQRSSAMFGPQQAAGAPGGAPSDDPYGGFRTTPGYEFMVDEADRAFNRQKTRTGSLYSGAALREAARYSTGLADQEYSDYYNRLAGIAGVGQTATQQSGNLGARFGENISSAGMQAGANRASGIVGQGQANSAIVSGVGDIADSALGWWQNRKVGGGYGSEADNAMQAGVS